MGRRRAEAELRRDAEFAAFTAGAGGRLLHAATLLTGDPAEAERLLTAVLARVYADWLRMRAEDPYEQARSELVRRFACRPWWRRPHGGALDRLSAQERLVVTMRFFEGIAEEQTAAQLGLPAERVHAIGARAAATLRSRPAPAPPAPAAAPAGAPAPAPAAAPALPPVRRAAVRARPAASPAATSPAPSAPSAPVTPSPAPGGAHRADAAAEAGPRAPARGAAP
ncbi:sigma factor-like helix-turn-helix DNA-binding protein [Actinacidiphila sp. DG2A-62]|uniref:sigma factor-like helix-turn-helix DNA-binding protein n=1 Tax=Actinacidiphila sp. DG2A-62 TaxID=3108821 RepID=UPI003FA36A2F